MPVLILIFFFCVSGAIYASDTAKVRKFWLGLTVSPDLVFRYLQNTDHSATSNMVHEMYQETDRPRMSYSGGLFVLYTPSARWSYEAGLRYADRGFGTAKSELTYGSAPRRGFTYTNPGDLPSEGKFVYHYRYIDAPLLAHASLGRKKTKILVSAGLEPGILVNQTNYFIGKMSDGADYKSSSTNTNAYRRFALGVMAGAGVAVPVGKSSYLRAEPAFAYDLLKNIDAPVPAHLWTCGLRLSFYLGI